jgi:5-methyltetrahydropteroyltriglutamate--homocysteine methyltransferase
MAHAPFRADHVGSFLRPERLKLARERKERGEIDAGALRAVEDECIREVVAMQEGVGLHAITDGEFRRNSFHMDLLLKLEGVTVGLPAVASGGARQGIPQIHTQSKLRRVRGIATDEFKFVKSITKRTPKVTIPSPSMLHFRGGRDAVDRTAYPDMEEFYGDLVRVWKEEIAELAALGCRYVQLDDTNLAYLCDPAHRTRAKERGEDPDALTHLYARLITQVYAGRPQDMAATIHLCRGNFQSTWMAEGGYDPVAEIMFQETDIDGFFLEYDDERSGGFAPLRFVPKGKKRVVLGLISSKKGELESEGLLKSRIDEACKFIALDQLCLSPQCGFSSTVHGNKLTRDDQKRKLELLVKVATDVWGTAA